MPTAFSHTLDRVKDRLFSRIHASNLVYNTCWEDPRIDRHLMALDEHSEVVMITSAGCNALDYLLDGPRAVHCIDMNPRQNALLELKQALLAQSDHPTLFAYFGYGRYAAAETTYRARLRPLLSDFARQYWDRNIGFFDGSNPRRSFYFRGSSGTFAWYFYRYLRSTAKGRRALADLFEARDLHKQAEAYLSIEPLVHNGLTRWVMNRHLTMSLLGVPRAQQDLILEQYPGKLAGFLHDSLRRVFTELPFWENYFWRLYLQGHYDPDCCPAYLSPAHFERLRLLQERVQTHTTTISRFLQAHPGAYSHFVLLDHQDWLAAHDETALEEEWRLILANSRPGAKILLRSAALEVDFLPAFVHEQVDIRPIEPALHHQDRVGTYASAYLGVVR
jgi:S-adenosylmethionine-diacylglycerol 3-amino-3-carboxypropyl transferase